MGRLRATVFTSLVTLNEERSVLSYLLRLASRLFSKKNRLVKPRVVTCSTFATIFVATQVARPHAVTANMPQDR